jgi:hypothetical protein
MDGGDNDADLGGWAIGVICDATPTIEGARAPVEDRRLMTVRLCNKTMRVSPLTTGSGWGRRGGQCWRMTRRQQASLIWRRWFDHDHVWAIWQGHNLG